MDIASFMLKWTKIGLIMGGLGLLFLLDELFVIFILKDAFPKVFHPSLFKIALAGVGVISFLLTWVVYKAFQKRPTTGKEGLIGERGKALSAIYGQGEVFVHGEVWKAMSEDEIQEGDAIEVMRADGLALEVRKVNT
ncbi:MAG: NfeD family protein [Syntrophobacterales bacterium]|nr:MAG: NfeD family protein [Syntrophobacterales bacterium]